jgi:hypothetical protein
MVNLYELISENFSHSTFCTQLTFLLLHLLSRWALFPLDVISNQHFFHLTLCRRFLGNILSSSYWPFVLVGVYFFRQYVPFGVFSDVFSAYVILPSAFLNSTFCQWIPFNTQCLLLTGFSVLDPIWIYSASCWLYFQDLLLIVLHW